MSDKGFIPLSAQLGIPGSSYRVQLGKVNNIWAVRMAKGNDILDSKVFRDHNDPEGTNPPNANSVVAWILSVLPIPNLNPYQIVKSVGFIRQESIRRSEEAKRKPAISLKEAKDVKLETVPENEKRAISKQVGWVKEDAVKTETSKEEEKTPKRVLPTIPTAGPSKSESKKDDKGIECKECGTEIKFCPYCGKPLSMH